MNLAKLLLLGGGGYLLWNWYQGQQAPVGGVIADKTAADKTAADKAAADKVAADKAAAETAAAQKLAADKAAADKAAADKAAADKAAADKAAADLAAALAAAQKPSAELVAEATAFAAAELAKARAALGNTDPYGFGAAARVAAAVKSWLLSGSRLDQMKRLAAAGNRDAALLLDQAGIKLTSDAWNFHRHAATGVPITADVFPAGDRGYLFGATEYLTKLSTMGLGGLGGIVPANAPWLVQGRALSTAPLVPFGMLRYRRPGVQ